MKVTVLVFLMSAVIAEGVNAQGGVELWRGLRAGMTKDQARGVLPKGEVDLLPDCRANVNMRFEAGGLRSVTLVPKWIMSKNHCVEPVTATLLEKYGRPSDKAETTAGNQFMAAEDYVVSLWKTDVSQIILRRQVNGLKWSLTYEPVREEDGVRVLGL